jgi:hypothetical protein
MNNLLSPSNLVCKSLGLNINDESKILYKVCGSLEYEGEQYCLYFSKKEDAEKALEQYNLLKKNLFYLKKITFRIEEIYYF